MKINITIKIDDCEVVNVTKEVETEKESNVDVSHYARVFDESCPGWDKNPEYSLLFLKQQQMYANELLKQKGHLFLNEVYEMLGFPKSKEGQIVGWVYCEDNKLGDNYVDFGIYDNRLNHDFVNGYERSVLLDFNVDGNILDRIE